MAACLVGCSAEPRAPLGATLAPLEAVCVEPQAALPDGAWTCGESRTLECAGPQTSVDYLYAHAPPPADLAEGASVCAGGQLQLSDDGPWPVGEYTIGVSWAVDGAPADALCDATLSIVDTTPPVVTALAPEPLWPPNGKVHTVGIGDCVQVEDVCDEAPTAQFVSATSDEAVNATGDGNTEPDIVDFGPSSVGLRAERSGSGDGRVYRLDWEVFDFSNNRVVGTCVVTVPHDQGGGAEAVDSGEVYRVDRL